MDSTYKDKAVSGKVTAWTALETTYTGYNDALPALLTAANNLGMLKTKAFSVTVGGTAVSKTMNGFDT